MIIPLITPVLFSNPSARLYWMVNYNHCAVLLEVNHLEVKEPTTLLLPLRWNQSLSSFTVSCNSSLTSTDFNVLEDYENPLDYSQGIKYIINCLILL